MWPVLGKRRNIIDVATQVFGDRTEAYSWLARPNEHLDNSPPADLLTSEEGAERVLKILDRLAAGYMH